MTTPAQYEAAIRLLADLRRVALIAVRNAPDEQVRRMKHELSVGLDSALAIVREAREQDAARRRVEVWNATGLEDDDAR